MGAGGPATHSVASVVATLEVEGSELLRPLPLVRRWRTKQNLDYCFLMMYAQSKGIYYVQLEDDIIAKPNYLSTMKNFALQQPSEDWMILEFSQLGFIGKMFKSLDLSVIVEFILMFYRDKPIDWLLDHILWVKVCNPEKDEKHCDRQKANLRIRFKPSLFQHVGTHSSLAGKIQKLKVGGAALGRVEHSRASAELRQGGGGQSRPPSTCVPPPPGQGLWEACAADGAREPTGRGEHEPQDVPALHPGEGLPARGFLLGLHTLCRGLHPLLLLPAAATGAVLLP